MNIFPFFALSVENNSPGRSRALQLAIDHGIQTADLVETLKARGAR